ncbi:hypothetical protein BDN71DRAFT_1382881, partial [Pleurotus eryngii]
YLQFDIQWSSLALLFYDCALTFPLEVKYIWGSKGRVSTIPYVFGRYALGANVLYVPVVANRLKQGVPFLQPPLSNYFNDALIPVAVRSFLLCDTWCKIIGALSVLGRAAVILTFTGRVYAIYARNKYILIYLSFLGLVCIALDFTHVPGLHCVGSSTRSHVHASSTFASFRATAGDVVSGLVSQFGDDPVETVQRGTVAGESKSSATSGGAGSSGGIPLVEPQSGHAYGSLNAA